MSKPSRWTEPKHDTPAFATLLGAFLVMVTVLFTAIADGARQADPALAAAPPASSVLAAHSAVPQP